MAKKAAKGTLLQKGAGTSPETYTTVGNVFTGEGPGEAAEMLDFTDHSSPDGYREFKAGLNDGGEVSGELHFDMDNATHDESTGLIAELQGRTEKSWRLTFPDNSTVTFTGIMSQFNPSWPVDGKQTAAFTLKVSGKPVWAQAA
jgi:hypothetical protein